MWASAYAKLPCGIRCLIFLYPVCVPSSNTKPQRQQRTAAIGMCARSAIAASENPSARSRTMIHCTRSSAAPQASTSQHAIEIGGRRHEPRIVLVVVRLGRVAEPCVTRTQRPYGRDVETGVSRSGSASSVASARRNSASTSARASPLARRTSSSQAGVGTVPNTEASVLS